MFRDPIKELCTVVLGLAVATFKFTVGVLTILAAIKYLRS